MRKFKVILINLNSVPNLEFEPVFPIGAVYVQSYLNQIGVEVKFVDFHLSPDNFNSLNFLYEEEFDSIAFSLRNVDSMELDSKYYFPYYNEIMTRIVNNAKKINPSALILLGGGGYSVYHKGLKNTLPFDVGITGNVEEDLFEAIKNHTQKLDENFRLIENFLPFEIQFDEKLVKIYLSLGAKQIGLPTRCGGRCPMKCVYCSYGKIDNKTNITRPITILRNDILQLYNMGVREIFLLTPYLIFHSHMQKTYVKCLSNLI